MSISRPAGTGPVVFTNKARCRDCYRCVRVCPVKAIRMHEGQANVVEARCISCGTCVRECPQGAKSYRHDLGRARELFAPGVRVAASVAPSFAAVFPAWQRRRLPSALRRLGFAYVGETAIGAYHVAVATAAAVAARPRAIPRLHGLPRRGPLRGTLPPAAGGQPRAGRVAHAGPRPAHPPVDGRRRRGPRRVHRALRGEEGRGRSAGARRAGRLRA